MNSDEAWSWRSYVSRLGPPITTADLEAIDAAAAADAGAAAAARWRLGAGRLRVAWHQDDRITAMSSHGETLCVGTRGGRLRALDLESGSIVGEYYLGSNAPAAPVTALHFDGVSVVIGDESGHVRAWRAELPGPWGFAHSPEWLFVGGGAATGSSAAAVVSKVKEVPIAHRAAVTALAKSEDGYISGDASGSIVLWGALDEGASVRPGCRWEAGSGLRCLCAGPDRRLYAGLERGLATLWGPAPAGAGEGQGGDGLGELVHQGAEAPVTALAWDAAGGCLLVGREDGMVEVWRPLEDGNLELAGSFGAALHAGSAIRGIAGGSAAGSQCVITTAADGRVGVWDSATGQALWGLQGLDGTSSVALGDSSRLVACGFTINRGLSPAGSTSQLSRDWRAPSLGQRTQLQEGGWECNAKDATAPTCEGVLCIDFKGGSAVRSDQEVDFFPQPQELYAEAWAEA